MSRIPRSGRGIPYRLQQTQRLSIRRDEKYGLTTGVLCLVQFVAATPVLAYRDPSLRSGLQKGYRE